MLRRTAAVLVLSLFLALPASAQLLPGLSGIGVKGGVSIATLRGDITGEEEGTLDPGYSTGFVGGIFGQFEVIPFITPRIEALYVQKGASVDDLADDASYNLDYIEIPVLAKVNLPIINLVFPSFYVGPYLSFAINREVDAGDGTDTIDADDLFDSTDYGLVFGTDVDLLFAGKGLVLSARYDLGLRNVVNEDIVGEGEDADLKTGTFIVTLGVSI